MAAECLRWQSGPGKGSVDRAVATQAHDRIPAPVASRCADARVEVGRASETHLNWSTSCIISSCEKLGYLRASLSACIFCSGPCGAMARERAPRLRRRVGSLTDLVLFGYRSVLRSCCQCAVLGLGCRSLLFSPAPTACVLFLARVSPSSRPRSPGLLVAEFACSRGTSSFDGPVEATTYAPCGSSSFCPRRFFRSEIGSFTYRHRCCAFSRRIC